MALPDGVTTVTVTSGEPLTLPDGTPYQGYLKFTAPDVVTLPGLDVTFGGTARAELDATGSFSIDLPPGDLEGMDPGGWAYQVQGVFANGPGWARWLPLTSAQPTVVLADVLVANPTGTHYAVVPGPRGNSVLHGEGAPSAGDGQIGDWWIDNTAPAALVIYGPKTGGGWGQGQAIGGGAAGALLAVNNLADVADAAGARQHLGLGGAAVLDVGTEDGTVAAGDDLRLWPAAPWRFNIETYGAIADVQVVTDAAVNGTTAAVTCSTSHPFVTGDIGKIAIILHAGPSGLETFASPITGVSSSSTATLQDTPPTAVTGATLYFGTNCYAAKNAAVDAAEAYLKGTGTGAASKPHDYAQVYTPNNAYISHGPLQTSKDGYGQVVYGVFDETKHKVGLDFCGVAPVSAGVRHWEQLVPQGGGSCWISTYLFSSTSASNTNQAPDHFGIAGVISGPNEGQLNGQPWGSLPGGRDTPIYSNVMVMVRNMSFLTAYSSLGANIGFLNAFGSANYYIENVSEGALAIVGDSADLASPAQFSAAFSVAMVGSSPGNNDLCYIKNLSLNGGHAFGAWISEHTLADRYMCLYTWAGLVIVGSYGGSAGASHAAKVIQASIEACTHEVYLMGPGAQGITMIDIDQLQTEDGHPNITGNSAAAIAAGRGRVGWTGLFDADNVKAQLVDGTPTPCGIEQVNGQVPRAIRRITADHAITALDRTIIADPSAGALTATLPDAAFCAVEYVLKNASDNPLTVATTSSQVIYTTTSTGATTATVATGATLRLQAAYTGSSWAWYAV